MPICNRCLKNKSDEDFAWRWKVLGIKQKVCRECRKREQDLWYKKHKQARLENVRKNKSENRIVARDFVWKYLLNHPCDICGESDPTVLEFHHLYGKDKAISQLVAEGATVAKILREIEKTQVLYCNCHRRVTSNEKGWFKK
jgi:hypothetical protein